MANSATTNDVPRRKRRRLRVALWISVAFHLVVIALLLVYRPWESATSGDAAVPSSGSTAAAPPPPTDPRAPIKVGTDPESITGDQVKVRIDHTVDQVDAMSEDDRLAMLKDRVARLDEVASDESVGEMSDKLHGWLDTAERAAEPAEPIAPGEPIASGEPDEPAEPGASSAPMEFDAATGQFVEVRRQRGPDGKLVYTGVLKDAQGQTMEIPMDAAEGEQIRQTLKILKGSPLAQEIYRQIALPLMDKMIREIEKPLQPPRLEGAVPEGEGPDAPEPDDEPPRLK